MLKELVKVGLVTKTYPDKGKVRVKIIDADDEVSYKLPVIFNKTFKDKDYWMPDIGEHVVVLFSAEGLEQGYILGAIYSDKDKVPVVSQDKCHRRFKDGTTIEYDRKKHLLSVHSVGDIKIVSDTHITLIAPRIDLNP
jgi:phage baseplate assembly protein V